MADVVKLDGGASSVTREAVIFALLVEISRKYTEGRLLGGWKLEVSTNEGGIQSSELLPWCVGRTLLAG